jgi:hypothetical protein
MFGKRRGKACGCCTVEMAEWKGNPREMEVLSRMLWVADLPWFLARRTFGLEIRTLMEVILRCITILLEATIE